MRSYYRRRERELAGRLALFYGFGPPASAVRIIRDGPTAIVEVGGVTHVITGDEVRRIGKANPMYADTDSVDKEE